MAQSKSGHLISASLQRARGQLERYLFYFERGPNGDFVPSERPRLSAADLVAAEGGAGTVADQLTEILAAEAALFARLNGQTYRSRRKSQRAARLLEAFRQPPAALYQELAQLTEREVSSSDWPAEFTAGLFGRYASLKAQLRQARKALPGPLRGQRELLKEIDAQHRRLITLVEGLSQKDLSTSGVVGGWSVKDVLAHLTAWSRLFQGWHAAGLSGQPPEVPARGYAWRDMHRLNDAIYQANRSRSADEILVEFSAAHTGLVALVRSIPEADLHIASRYAWMGRGNLWGYVRANSSNHYRWAAIAIRKWSASRKMKV